MSCEIWDNAQLPTKDVSILFIRRDFHVKQTLNQHACVSDKSVQVLCLTWTLIDLRSGEGAEGAQGAQYPSKFLKVPCSSLKVLVSTAFVNCKDAPPVPI